MEPPAEQSKPISKNQMARDAKKIKKKVAQALAVMLKAEKVTQVEELVLPLE